MVIEVFTDYIFLAKDGKPDDQVIDQLGGQSYFRFDEPENLLRLIIVMHVNSTCVIQRLSEKLMAMAVDLEQLTLRVANLEVKDK